MDPITWWLIGSAVVSIAGSLYSGYQQREKGKTEADYQALQTQNRINAETYNRDTALGKLDLELALDKHTAEQKAGNIETSAKSDFTGTMERTYLGQLGAEANLLNLKTQGVEAVGSLEAGAAARGLRAPTTTKDVLQSNIQSQVNQTRKQIDSGLSSTVSANKANLDLNLKNASDLRAQFNPGSAYMDVFNYTKKTIQGSSGIALEGLANQKSYLGDLSKSYDYNAGWFLTDLFNVGSMGIDTYTTGKQWGIF